MPKLPRICLNSPASVACTDELMAVPTAEAEGIAATTEVEMDRLTDGRIEGIKVVGTAMGRPRSPLVEDGTAEEDAEPPRGRPGKGTGRPIGRPRRPPELEAGAADAVVDDPAAERVEVTSVVGISVVKANNDDDDDDGLTDELGKATIAEEVDATRVVELTVVGAAAPPPPRMPPTTGSPVRCVWLVWGCGGW